MRVKCKSKIYVINKHALRPLVLEETVFRPESVKYSVKDNTCGDDLKVKAERIEVLFLTTNFCNVFTLFKLSFCSKREKLKLQAEKVFF